MTFDNFLSIIYSYRLISMPFCNVWCHFFLKFTHDPLFNNQKMISVIILNGTSITLSFLKKWNILLGKCACTECGWLLVFFIHYYNIYYNDNELTFLCFCHFYYFFKISKYLFSFNSFLYLHCFCLFVLVILLLRFEYIQTMSVICQGNILFKSHCNYCTQYQ